MPDEKKATETVAKTTEETASEETPQAGQEPEEEPFNRERAMATIAKQREEIKKIKADHQRQIEANEKARKEAEMTEIQKAQAKTQELETKLAEYESEMQELRLRHAVERAAGAMKFINPDEAYKLADLSAIEFDEEGKLDAEAIDTALKALAKRSPYLLEQGETQPKEKKAPDIGATPGRAGTGVNKDQLTEEKQQELIRRYRMNV